MVARPHFKICGVTSLEDAQLAADCGAWAVGVILWEGSPRRCDPAVAELIARTLRRRTRVCGVFHNAPLDEVLETVDALSLTMAQLHGDEGPAFCDEVRRRTGAEIIKAARVASSADVQDLARFHHVDYHLLDTHRDHAPGGTGETFDWSLAASRRSPVPLILSGGLNPGNVAAAIAAVSPFAVDVASGTESSPGVKDPAKVRAFAEAVRPSAEDAVGEPAAAPATEPAA